MYWIYAKIYYEGIAAMLSSLILLGSYGATFRAFYWTAMMRYVDVMVGDLWDR